MNEIRQKILEAVVEEYNYSGMKFTMDDVSKRLHMSKKTIYKEFDTKDELFSATVDYVFSFIKAKEKQIMEDDSLTTVEKISKIMVCLPDNMESIDFRKLYRLRYQYPEIYGKVAKRIETGWEDTIALLEQGIQEGVIKPISIPVLKTMVESSIEKFFGTDVLLENNINYESALAELIQIIMSGITVEK